MITNIITIVCVLVVVVPCVARIINLYKVKAKSNDASWKSSLDAYMSTVDRGISGKTVVEAESLINIETLYSANKINYTKLRNTPNSLVGIGILGTFLGLSVALMADLNLSDTETTINSVHALLEGMKTAFFTSVAGMASSIIFGYLFRMQTNNLQSEIAKKCKELDEKYLTSATVEVAESINLIERQNEILAQLGRSIGESMAASIAENFAVIIQKMEEELDKQTASMREMSTNLGSSVNNLVTEELEKSFKELMDAVTNRISSQLTDASVMLKESTEHLATSTTALQNGSESMRNSAKNLYEASDSLGIGAGIIKDYTGDLKERSEAIGNNIDKLNDTISEIGDAANQFSGAASTTAETVKDAIEGIHIDAIFKTLNEFMESIADFVEESKNVSELLESIPNAKDVIKEISNATSAYIQTLHISVNELTTSYTSKFTDACDSINGTVQKLDSTMSSARGRTENSVNNIVGILNRAAENLNNAVTAIRRDETEKR